MLFTWGKKRTLSIIELGSFSFRGAKFDKWTFKNGKTKTELTFLPINYYKCLYEQVYYLFGSI